MRENIRGNIVNEYSGINVCLELRNKLLKLYHRPIKAIILIPVIDLST
jgi:hypothetical protein